MLVCGIIEKEAHESYFANLLWSILQFVSKGKSEYPSYADIFAEEAREDGKTADEILSMALRMLDDGRDEVKK